MKRSQILTSVNASHTSQGLLTNKLIVAKYRGNHYLFQSASPPKFPQLRKFYTYRGREYQVLSEMTHMSKEHAIYGFYRGVKCKIPAFLN